MADERQGVTRPGGDVEVATPRQGIVQSADFEAYRQAQIAEYSKWIAKTDIYAGLALAYRKGDPVPASNVEAQKYDEMGLVELASPPEAPASSKPAK